MAYNPAPLERLIEHFAKFNGIGRKGAARLAYQVLTMDASQAMAFGDSLNDLEMLKTVGVGVAMGNATARLKAIADDVCGTVDENGIYHYCIAHGLI